PLRCEPEGAVGRETDYEAVLFARLEDGDRTRGDSRRRLQILPRTLENEAAGTLEVFTIDADLPAHQHGQFDSFARLHRFAGAQIVVFSRGRGSNHEESRVGV